MLETNIHLPENKNIISSNNDNIFHIIKYIYIFRRMDFLKDFPLTFTFILILDCKQYTDKFGYEAGSLCF